MKRVPQYRRIGWIALLLLGAACDGQKTSLRSPAGYDLNKPEVYRMPGVLHEISGISFREGRGDTIYAEQDEEGKLFHFRPGDKEMFVTKFGKAGDYEDVTVCRETVVLLRSDGVLFSLPLREANRERTDSTRVWEHLLPEGEYEGLASVESTGQLVVLCKHCADDKTSRSVGGFLFVLDRDGNIRPSGNFSIDVRAIESLTGEKKIRFHPSALARNPVTSEWYILSAVNKLLVVTGPDWGVKEVYSLSASFFPQPEGIAFTSDGDLYISNERNTTAYGTILKFRRGPAGR